MEEKEKQKQMAAKRAASYIRDNMTIGLGTGSTAYYLIQEVGKLVEAGMRLRAAVTSSATGQLAVTRQIPVILPEETKHIDLAIDGVDEIDHRFCAVKGGGGALLREKIIASNAEEVIWIMDESKQVDHLGAFPLPVEVLPFGYSWAAESIGEIGGNAVRRKRNGQNFRTDNGNFILDITFDAGTDYREAANEISRIPGVLETGYFDSICSRIIVGRSQEVQDLKNVRFTSD